MKSLKNSKALRVCFTILTFCITWFIVTIIIILNIDSSIIGSILCVLAAPLSIYIAILLKNKVFKEAMQKIAEEKRIALAERQHIIETYSNGENLPTVITDSIVLQNDEKCHYVTNAIRQILKTETLGYTGRSRGMTFRIAKGVSYRTGGGGGRAIKGEVSYQYSGDLYITSKRIIFVSNKEGFIIPLNKLVSRTQYKDGLSLQNDKKTFIILVKDADIINAIITGALKKVSI